MKTLCLVLISILWIVNAENVTQIAYDAAILQGLTASIAENIFHSLEGLSYEKTGLCYNTCTDDSDCEDQCGICRL
jgi:hypothetical protein